MESVGAIARGRGARAFDSAVEPLEGRRLLTASTISSGRVAALSQDGATLAVPVLNSRPSAAKQLYLDFDGAAAFSWSGTQVPATPAFSRDGDVTTFSAKDLAAIRTIWQAVADKYSMFDINITTVAPRALADGVASAVIIGGRGEWYGQDLDGRYYGGVSYLRSFQNSLDNRAFVFDQNFASISDVATAAAHEAAHTFGLEHHRTFDSRGALIAEYADGPSDGSNTGYIMGQPGFGRRMVWANVNGGEFGINQDDFTWLGNVLGTVPDAEGNTRATAVAFTHAGHELSSEATKGGFTHLIQSTADKDYFRFTTAGGTVDLTAVAPEGGMLDLNLELRSAGGTVLARDTGLEKPFIQNTRKRILTTVPAGTYYVVVSSAGGAGNIGLYAITGTEGGSTRNLSTGRTYTASSTYAVTGYEARRAGDGSLVSRWISAYPATTPQWLSVDLGQAAAISEVDLTWGRGNATAYALQASYDGKTWQTFYTTTTGGTVEETLTGLRGAGRYVRLLTSAHKNAGPLELYEFAVLGNVTTATSPATTGRISGYAFNDSNTNARYDTGDTLAAGKTIWLDLDNDGVKDANEPSTLTSTSGAFTFTNLAAGTYRVRRLFPAGYVESTPPRTIALSAGQTVTNVAIGSRRIN